MEWENVSKKELPIQGRLRTEKTNEAMLIYIDGQGDFLLSNFYFTSTERRVRGRRARDVCVI